MPKPDLLTLTALLRRRANQIVFVGKVLQEEGVVGGIGDHGQCFERRAPYLHGARVLQGVAHFRRCLPITQQAGGLQRLHLNFFL